MEGGGDGWREGEVDGGRGRWVEGGGDGWREGEMGGGRGDGWREGEMGGGRGRWVEGGGDRWRLGEPIFLGGEGGEVSSAHSLVSLARGLASIFPLPSRGLAPADCSGEEDDDPDTMCCLGLVPHQVCVCVCVCLCFCV